jgi:hypothetical protein
MVSLFRVDAVSLPLSTQRFTDFLGALGALRGGKVNPNPHQRNWGRLPTTELARIPGGIVIVGAVMGTEQDGCLALAGVGGRGDSPADQN